MEPVIGLKVEIEDVFYRKYYKTTNQIDTISNVFYDPFSKSNYVLLNNSTQEYKWPSNLKVIK